MKIQQITTLLCVLGLSAAAGAADEENRTLMWDDLIPKEEKALGTATQPVDPWAQGASQSPAVSVVAELDGQAVRLPGFIVPLESDEVGLLSEFFLVPYFGACIHVPPPPPNQLVYVKLDEPFELKSLWDPFWVSGEMKAKGYESVMGQAGYTINNGEVAPYDWPE
ncbi:MAG: DUF3299 domain-containing protein [Pseudomonadota bacterium]